MMPEYLSYFERILKKTYFVFQWKILWIWCPSSNLNRKKNYDKNALSNHGQIGFYFFNTFTVFFHYCKNYLQNAVMVQTKKISTHFRKKKSWYMSTLNFDLGNCSNFLHLRTYFLSSLNTISVSRFNDKRD